MRPSLKNLSVKAHDAAAGSPVPAGQEPPPSDPAAVAAGPGPTTAERGSIRKRVRRLARLREVQLRELGALVVEMRRLQRENPELVARKAAELLALDEELRALRAALGSRETVGQIVAVGVAGSCRRCDTLLATDDHFCPRCGLAVEAAPVPAQAATVGGPGAEPAAGPEATPPAPAAEAPPALVAEPPPPPPPEAPPAVAAKPPPAPAAGTPPPPAAEPREAPAAEAAAPPPPPPPPPRDRGQTELTATVPPQP
jgi:hypothetical protein